MNRKRTEERTEREQKREQKENRKRTEREQKERTERENRKRTEREQKENSRKRTEQSMCISTAVLISTGHLLATATATATSYRDQGLVGHFCFAHSDSSAKFLIVHDLRGLHF